MQRITSRDFFASLRYTDPESTIHCAFNQRIGATGYPIFTEAELTNEPLKWLKYLLLARLGLRPLEGLTQEIQRYPISHWRVARSQCIEVLSKAHQHQQFVLVVIKLVPRDKAGQLPNFRILQIDDVEPVFEAVCRAQRPTDVEIWLCQSTIGVGTLSLAGRLTLPINNSFGPSYVEVVWYTSPRLLENIDLATFAYPYLRAVRQVAELTFRVSTLHIPPLYRSVDETTTAQFMEQFSWVGRQIQWYHEKIQALEAIVTAAGAKELSLEFKSDKGHFRFIDWDTEVEVGGWLA